MVKENRELRTVNSEQVFVPRKRNGEETNKTGSRQPGNQATRQPGNIGKGCSWEFADMG
jgi:hypothetical protein